MSKKTNVPHFQQARGYLVDRKKIREIRVSKLKWNLQKILKTEDER